MSASGLRRGPVTLVWLPHAALSVVGIHTFYAVPVADSKSVGSYLFATGIRRRRTGYATDEEIHVPIFAVFEPNVWKQIRRDLR